MSDHMASSTVSAQFETLEIIKTSERGTIERIRDVRDGSIWIRRIYLDDKREVFDILSSLDSPLFPRIRSIVFTDRTAIVEEEIKGSLLSEVLLTRQFSRREAQGISYQLLSALSVLHEHSVIHRDVKPDNIILSQSDRRVVLIDFSISRVHRKDSSRDTSLFGTEGYAAPEQFGFSQTDSRSDLYSAGVVIRELCENAKLKETDSLRKFADRCASFDPKHRYEDAPAALWALRKIQRRPLIWASMSIVFAALALALLTGWDHLFFQKSIVPVTIADAPSKQPDTGTHIDLLSVAKDNNELYLSITPLTQAREIYYKFSEGAEYRSTGFLGQADPATGEKMPNKTIRAKISPHLTIYSKYVGVDRQEYGPYVQDIDTAREALDMVKRQILTEHVPWLNLRGHLSDDQIEMFTSIFAMDEGRYAVEKITYGINTVEPDIERFSLEAPDLNNRNGDLGTIDKNNLRFVSMRVFFKDGTQSDVRVYEP